ncbi:hypothetical protein NHQ30_011122 [Ciborinia camelliae]|nr:hypothetical protein NHQ30_011122 [Ciborinia camelliae]
MQRLLILGLHAQCYPADHEMIKGLHLITMSTPNGKKVQILLEELKAAYGTEYTHTLLHVMTNEQKKDWFLKLNPNGRIPILVDNTKTPPFPVMETSAELLYLLKEYDRKDLFGFKDKLERSECLQWLFYWHGSGAPAIQIFSFYGPGIVDLDDYQGQVNFFAKLSSEKNPGALKRFRDEHLRTLGVLEIHLSGKYNGGPRDYLAGNGKGKYSVADIGTWPWVSNWDFSDEITQEDMNAFPHLLKWIGRIAERPAVQSGTAKRWENCSAFRRRLCFSLQQQTANSQNLQNGKGFRFAGAAFWFAENQIFCTIQLYFRMDPTTVYTPTLAEASHFEEWFKIAISWKIGKEYRSVPSTKEEKVDRSKRELTGLSTPPVTPLKPKFPSSLNSSVSVRPFSFKSSSALPVSKSSSLAPPFFTPPTVVANPDRKSAVVLDSTSQWVANLPSHPKSLAPPYAPPPPQDQPPVQIDRFENEFFDVKTSPKGGLGCFARTDIPCGTMIHSEEPLFICSVLQVHYHFEQLTAEQQAAYLNLHCWQGLASHKIVAIFQTNRFHINGGKAGIFLNSSRFNHACPGYRTCSYSYDKDIKKMVFTTILDITKGQELTIAYATVPNDLYQNYGFFCDCPGCPSKDDQYKNWKCEDDLRKKARLDDSKEVEFEQETYPVKSAWENDVYEW